MSAPHSTYSIRQNLLRSLGKVLPVMWLLITVLSIPPVLHEINEAGDTAMVQLARNLLSVETDDDDDDIEILLNNKQMIHEGNKGNVSNSFSGFAIWNESGRLLLSDSVGARISFEPEASGFVNHDVWWHRDAWRTLYLQDKDQERYVAVTFRWKERLETLLQAMLPPLLLWLLSLPILLWVLARGIRTGLKPLDDLSDELTQRDANSLLEVSEDVPAEVLPLVHSLNSLFGRVSTVLEREQRFTSDAAHELRSPLAALRVQVEVLAMSQDPQEQAHHSAQVQASIKRAENLISQLLVLARIDPAKPHLDWPVVDWNEISAEALQSVNLNARERYIKLQREISDKPLPIQGDAVLLQLMLRNLLDNAVRYSPEQSKVMLVLADDFIEVYDQGAGVSEHHLDKLAARFYRPAGQNEQGSGLGLAIVEQVARLHGLKLILSNKPEGGFSARLERILTSL